MNEQQFGTRLTADGASFRLWAPAAKRVDLLLEKPQPMRRDENGWFGADIAGVRAGARYRFRIDDEIDVPDPASAFQPDDVSGPSEVVDHSSYRWRAADWRRDVTWSQCRGGDLIEQRLKDVMVRSIDERHVGIGVLEGASRVQSPETTTDNYDFWSRGH